MQRNEVFLGIRSYLALSSFSKFSLLLYYSNNEKTEEIRTSSNKTGKADRDRNTYGNGEATLRSRWDEKESQEGKACTYAFTLYLFGH